MIGNCFEGSALLTKQYDHEKHEVKSIRED